MTNLMAYEIGMVVGVVGVSVGWACSKFYKRPPKIRHYLFRLTGHIKGGGGHSCSFILPVAKLNPDALAEAIDHYDAMVWEDRGVRIEKKKVSFDLIQELDN